MTLRPELTQMAVLSLAVNAANGFGSQIARKGSAGSNDIWLMLSE